MNSKFDDDGFSIANVSLLDENISHSSPRNLTSSPAPINNITKSNKTRRFSTIKAEDLDAPEDYNDKDLRAGTTSLKSQESAIDVLKKENFNLKLRLYFLEERLRDASPESVDKAIKENINLKVAIQSLTSELKKYKNVILELNQGIDILQNKKCPLHHGMTPEEKDDFDRLKSELEGYHDENDKLSRMMADLTAENVRLRTTIRSSRNNTNNTPNNHVENEDSAELQRKYRQAKLKIDEQHRMIQILQTKPNNNRSTFTSQSEDNLLKSAMSDKENNTHLQRQLETELRKERTQTDRAMREIQDKKSEINDLQLELDQYTKSLHDTKQQLRSKTIECEQLREQNDKIRVDSKDMSQLIEAVNELQQDNDELVGAIQSRDQDIAELEAEVEKLLSHLEKKGGEDGETNEEANSKIIILEEALQEREEEIDSLKKDLRSLTESHDDDIEALEEHIAKLQAEFNEKNQECKELLAEIEETKKEYEDELEKQYNEMVVSIRDREVRIATIEGNFEQKTDTMQRERDLLSEEIEELKDKVDALFNDLEEKKKIIAEMTSMLNNREESDFSFLLQSDKMQEFTQKWQEQVDFLKNELKGAQDKIRHERTLAKDELIHQNNAIRSLKQKLVTATKKNEILSTLVDQQRKSAEENKGTFKSDRSTSLMSKLNQELRKELEEKDRDLDQERSKSDEFEHLYLRELDNSASLKRQLERRDTMLTNSLLAHDALKEQGQFMENILYEQATGGGHHSFRERSSSGMSSY